MVGLILVLWDIWLLFWLLFCLLFGWEKDVLDGSLEENCGVGNKGGLRVASKGGSFLLEDINSY